MDMDFVNKKVNVSNVTALLKTALIGILLSEVLIFSQEISFYISEYVTKGGYENWVIWPGTITILLVAIYPLIRGCVREGVKICKSVRIDIFIIFFIGLLLPLSIDGIGTKFYQIFIYKLNPLIFVFSIILPIAIGIALIIRAFQVKFTKKKVFEPFFINDIEGEKKEGDLLDYADTATRFAERVFNGGAPDSLVFGIDAPWGIGKSTFVNYCIESWKDKKYEDKVIVYKFNPLRYEDRTNLLDKFIDGLIATIKNSSFTPEIIPLVSNYSRLIKNKGSFSFLGFEIQLSPGAYTVDDVLDDLKLALQEFDKKIIIIVDDLDRLDFSAVKDVLFAIKKSFTLSNISYILCYDTENIGALEKENKDVEKIREFLEKFVNVKISLFIESEKLNKFISDSSKSILGTNQWLYQSNTQLALQGLKEIFASPEYYNYVHLIGDLRKIKRYINILKLFELEKIDHGNSDFNSQDLTHLLLIYINYPSLFRKIYYAETENRAGFFSARIQHQDYYPEDENSQHNLSSKKNNQYKNSTLYNEYYKNGKLSDGQKFLLDKVFTVSRRLENAEIDSVSPDIKHTYACFNGDPWSGGGRNLEAYLTVIVKLKKPERHGQYRFYINAKEEIQNGISIEQVLSKEEFSFSQTENSHNHLWRAVVDGAWEFEPTIGSNLITYLLEHMTDYSFFTNEKIGVGLRDDIDFFLIKLLNTVGWSDQDGGHTDNSNENNLAEIAEWVFGESRHEGMGVLETLSKEDRGIIGLYDLMAFRLFCSADRGGDIFNLQRALSKHGNPSVPADINNVVEEMREISQKTFSIFKNQYITPKKNIFQLINDLTLEDFAGKYFGFIEEQVSLGKITEVEKDNAIASLKSRMKSFITYQLGNTFISSGIGCGYYDEVGEKDEKSIAVLVNEYMFECCFNPDINIDNYEHFLDYLLINFASIFATRKGGRSYIPHMNEFTKILDKAKLIEYWKTHSITIKALNLQQKNKTINTGNYIASYSEDLKEVFLVLDKAAEEAVPQISLPPLKVENIDISETIPLEIVEEDPKQPEQI